MKSINANKVVKTLHFIAKASDGDVPSLESKLNERGLYECVIELPLINKTVVGLGKSKLDSIDSATRISLDLINAFLKKNPHFSLEFSEKSSYLLEEDDEGNLCMHLINKVEC